MRIIAAALLYCLWPFHHRPVARVPENVSTITVVGAEDATAPPDRDDCDVSPEVGYVYAGNDGMVGTSHVSCEAAFQDWRHSPPPKHMEHLLA